ncbi:MAG: GtrA family protein [Nitrososphaerales archaeon]
MQGNSPSSSRRLKKFADSLNEKYGVFRAAKFGVAGAAGFLIAELLLVIGVFVFYHTTKVPSVAYSSPTILGLNVAAFGIGVTASFFINERITVKNQGEQKHRDARRVIARLLKFQLAYLLGNIITIGVQLLLLAEFSVSPVLGNIIGAIVAYPVSYFFSMRFVWSVKVAGQPPASAKKSPG